MGGGAAGPERFDLGPLGPGEAVEAIWKLRAARPGRHALRFRIGAGAHGAKAVTATATPGAPGGAMTATIAPGRSR